MNPVLPTALSIQSAPAALAMRVEPFALSPVMDDSMPAAGAVATQPFVLSPDLGNFALAAGAVMAEPLGAGGSTPAAITVTPQPFAVSPALDASTPTAMAATVVADMISPPAAVAVPLQTNAVMPVTVTDLIAALDRAARTTIVSSVPFGNDVLIAGSATKDAAPAADGDTTSQPATPDAQPATPVNPLAGLFAIAPVVVQAVIPAGQPAVDDGVQVANTMALKREARMAAATATATATAVTASPATPATPVDPAVINFFARSKDSAPVASGKAADPVVDVSVVLVSDPSDLVAAPTAPAQSTAAAASPVSAAQMPTVTPGDAVINRQLDLARGDAWLDTLARDIAASADTGSRLRFGLSPEYLGKLDVEVSRHEAGVSVQMTTRSEEARSIIAAAQPRLVDELRANGTRVVAADVAAQMNAQTNGQSGGTARQTTAGFIETAVAAETPAATVTSAPRAARAAGRYA